MRIRLYNAKICTMQEKPGLIEGEIWINGNIIEYVGPQKSNSDLTNAKFDKVIDVEGNLLLPGFKNAHSHSAMTFLRSYADDLPLLDWLHNQVFPMEAKLLKGEIYTLSKLAIMEYLSSGITACFDMYMKRDEHAKASVDCGFRSVLCGSVNDYGGSVAQELEDYAKYNNYHELISAQFGFHAEYTCSEQLLKDIAAAASQHKIPVYFHNSESKAEVLQCIERRGTTPTQYLNSIGMFEQGGGCFHCVHMTDEDIAIFKQKGLWVITNPGSNAKLASGIAPITAFTKNNINVAIGTDGPASNNCLDFFREMFLLTAMGKLRENDASAVDALSVLQMATSNGARAMGLNNCDCLAEGKYADIIMLDLQQPNMQPQNNILKNIVYSGSKINVKMTMVNGKILYQNGSFYLDEPPCEVYARANRIIDAKR